MELNPYHGLGVITFGMPRSEVIKLLGEPSDRFRKGVSATILTDEYSTLGMHIYFDVSDLVDYLDVFEPCDIQYEGIQLVGRPPMEVLDELSSLGIEYFEARPSFIVTRLGVALYAPGVDAEGDLIEGVGIFKSHKEITAVYPYPK